MDYAQRIGAVAGELSTIVSAVAAGDAAFSPRAARQLSTWVRDARGAETRRHAVAKMAQLTERERDFALALTDGASDAELA